MIEDKLDREILNALQEEFPLVERPFQVIGERFGISEDQAMARVQRMIDAGVIRRMGPIFNYEDMGLVGVLVAAKIAKDQEDRAAEVFAGLPEVTHAYLRDHAFNLWFTVIAEEANLDKVIDFIRVELKLQEVTKLPRAQGYKLDTMFEAR